MHGMPSAFVCASVRCWTLERFTFVFVAFPHDVRATFVARNQLYWFMFWHRCVVVTRANGDLHSSYWWNELGKRIQVVCVSFRCQTIRNATLIEAARFATTPSVTQFAIAFLEFVTPDLNCVCKPCVTVCCVITLHVACKQLFRFPQK